MLVRVFIRRLHVSPSCRLRAMPVPHTFDNFKQCLTTPPQQEGNLVRIAFIGDPNVGKSTIINRLLARDICSVSRKPHTTRDSAPIAVTSDDLQMILVDTPGAVNSVHARKHKLPKDMVVAPRKALDEQIDVLVAVIDASDKYRREYLSIEMARLLREHREHQPGTCSVLVLNKVDNMSNKRDLLDCIDSLSRGTISDRKVPRREVSQKRDLKQTIWEKEERRAMHKGANPEERKVDVEENDESELSPEAPDAPDAGSCIKGHPPRLESWPHFEKVFLVSALENDGIGDLKEFLLSRARKGIWKYRKEFITAKKPTALAEEIVASKLLDYLHKDVPYKMSPKVVDWALDDSGSLHVTVNIYCQQAREVREGLGKEGKTIKKISREARQQLSNLFSCEVSLKLVLVNQNEKKK